MRITSPEALSYWTFLGLRAYAQMMSRDGRLLESAEMKQALGDYRKANDLVQMAVEDEIIEFGPDFTIPRELLQMAFHQYAEDLGRKSPSSSKLIERISNSAPHPIESCRIGSRGEQVNVWRGLQLGEGGRKLRQKRDVPNMETQEIVRMSISVEELYEQGRKGRWQ